MKNFLIILLLSSWVWGMDLDKAIELYKENKYVESYDIFKNSCYRDNPRACFSLGVMLENAQGVERDRQKAMGYYGKACDLGLKEACSNLALSLEEDGRDNEARLAFNKACNFGEFQSCNNLAVFYENAKEGDLALHFYQKSCKLQDSKACYKLGLIYERGEWVRANPNKALSLYSNSCNFGLGEACYKLGRYHQLEKKDLQKAKRYFGMACDKKHREACAAYKEFNDRGIEIH